MPRLSSKLNSQIYSEAAEWFITCRSGALDEAGRRKFDTWLRQSPQHLSAYVELAAIWDEGPGLDAERRYDTDTLIAEALADRSNVTELTLASGARNYPAASWRVRWLAASIAMFAVGLATVV